MVPIYGLAALYTTAVQVVSWALFPLRKESLFELFNGFFILYLLPFDLRKTICVLKILRDVLLSVFEIKLRLVRRCPWNFRS